MINANVNRWGGDALVAGSVWFIVNKFNDMSRVFLTVPLGGAFELGEAKNG